MPLACYIFSAHCRPSRFVGRRFLPPKGTVSSMLPCCRRPRSCWKVSVASRQAFPVPDIGRSERYQGVGGMCGKNRVLWPIPLSSCLSSSTKLAKPPTRSNIRPPITCRQAISCSLVSAATLCLYLCCCPSLQSAPPAASPSPSPPAAPSPTSSGQAPRLAPGSPSAGQTATASRETTARGRLAGRLGSPGRQNCRCTLETDPERS
jgi:hypothetical protein